VVRDAKLGMGTGSEGASFETIESQGLSEDIYDVVEGLLPDLKRCMQTAAGAEGLRVVHVGAKVGGDGGVSCAVASASRGVPAEVRACAEGVLGRARFKPPNRGTGLLSVPIEVYRKR
jgi:hypothetical protein